MNQPKPAKPGIPEWAQTVGVILEPLLVFQPRLLSVATPLGPQPKKQWMIAMSSSELEFRAAKEALITVRSRSSVRLCA